VQPASVTAVAICAWLAIALHGLPITLTVPARGQPAPSPAAELAATSA